jgi:hypothetical protein
MYCLLYCLLYWLLYWLLIFNNSGSRWHCLLCLLPCLLLMLLPRRAAEQHQWVCYGLVLLLQNVLPVQLHALLSLPHLQGTGHRN